MIGWRPPVRAQWRASGADGEGGHREHHLQIILATGIALRIFVYLYQSPFNNDDHAGVITAFLATGRFPDIRAVPQAYHPPLYYLLALPWVVAGGWKAAQAFSLLLSIVNLYVLYVLLRDGSLGETCRALCLSLAAFLPQLVLFGNYVSNDALAFALGSLLVLQARAYIRRPSGSSRRDLALLLGLGLLTKLTFVAFAPCLLGLVLVTERRRGWRRVLAAGLAFVLIAGVVGSYKFVNDIVRYGRPAVTALELAPPGILAQKRKPGEPRQFPSIATLVRNPLVGPATTSSYPLLTYATFWYPHIPETNLRSATADRLVAPVIYVLALGPTLTMGIGLIRLVSRRRFAVAGPPLSTVERERRSLQGVSAALLLASLALVVFTGYRSEVWSVFQGRNLFPATAGLLALLALGLEALPQRVRQATHAILGLLYASFVFYFALLWLAPGG